MDEHEIREIRVRINGGELATIRVREKGKQTQEGVEGILFALLNPDTLREVGEYWAPIDELAERGRAHHSTQHRPL